MENYLQELNSQQQKAVQHIDGPLIVIAGAGSGKTRVITCRIANMLNNKINAFNILALTFTNKAAKEMRSRIDQITQPYKSASLWMGTFHSMFAKILRIESNKFNYPANFTIYDTEDSKSLVKSIIKELELDKEIYKPNVIRNRISSLKNHFIKSNDYNQRPELTQTDKIAKRDEFGRIYQIYEKRCQKSSALDFDDLLLKTYELFEENPDILLKYQEKFKYILIDEYQDTNFVQYLIIKKLAALYENICVVGDDAQSIYSFRGANIQNILNFKTDYPDFKEYKLEQNYRSTSNIVNAANSIIKNNEKQIYKEVWTKNEDGEKIIIIKTNSDHEEGRLVSNTIFEILTKVQAKNSDFAILYRTNAQSRAIEESLRRKNINYKIYGGLSFYQRKEIKDLLAYFRLTVNANDEESLKRIINYPTRGIGSTTIQKLNSAANKYDVSIWQILSNLDKYEIKINKGTKEKLSNFQILINNFINDSRKKDAYEVAEEITKSTGIYGLLYSDKTPEGITRFENIQELLNAIKNFSKHSEKKLNILSDFIEDVALLTDQDQENEEDYNKVTLMTIHAAKGLEFKYVFVVGMEENLFPSMLSNESQESLEEERRLFYVAITRAEKRLFLSYANTRFKWGQYIDSVPSRFLHEIDNRFIEKKETEEKKHYKIFPKRKTSFKPKQTKISSRLKKINLSKLDSVNNNIIELNVGIKVKHSIFGYGKVIKIDGENQNQKAIIFFNNHGQKQLLLKFAKLEIIE
tara:strand:+ start:8147 stop:10396 length:2250 start_codon:yes stop_codon:yes gene_type:complete